MSYDSDIDLVFKALGDPTRRRILDIIKYQPGISMNELTEAFDISRFGVRKHLLLLEEAHLISFRWERPVKRFYLNAVPIQMIYERWIAEYSKDRAERLVRLKHDLEELTMSDSNTQVFVVIIRCTPDKLWQALTQSEFTQQYYMGCALQSDLTPGAEIKYVHDESEVRVTGKVIACDPPSKFVHTFHPMTPDGPGPETTVTYTLEPMGENVKLTVVHENVAGADLQEKISEGWAMVLSGLKTLLETGSGLKM